ncbi:uncharacterized protein EAF02_011482 [Botrytis sinoallii]|uniref:uncharacterized protein n=1 Tax=Botrytis sinoallii TaxID=1463999 RepID=UPI0018FFF4D2|nr:uncharacterized protein EAF02_011482 [Botrytis sinoallii]KAF7856223.1 hypothetical protein EAF02_011482 [Botrytis sinoallii]
MQAKSTGERDQPYEKRLPEAPNFSETQVDHPGVRSQHSGTDMTENRVGPLGLVEVANIMIHDDDDDDDGWDG